MRIIGRFIRSHGGVVDILQVTTQVSTLCEMLVAEAALERSLTSMLSKVISEVA